MKIMSPDGSKITAHRGTTAIEGMIIHGAEGVVAPGATVTVTDKDGNTVTTTADENGLALSYWKQTFPWILIIL